ncbi:MAG: PAS-domain containing protein, partial [Pseudomonadota bacterium]
MGYGMPILDVTAGLILGTIAAALVLWWAIRLSPSNRLQTDGIDASMSFLFDNDQLVDASDAGEALLASSGSDESWSGLARMFQDRFSLTADSFKQPSKDGIQHFPARDRDDDGVLIVRKFGASIRVELTGGTTGTAADNHKVHLMKEQMEILENANQVAPFPIWHTDQNNQVKWFNPAYGELYQRVFKNPPNCDVPLFRLPEGKLEAGTPRRVPVTPPNTRQTVWYDVERLATGIGDFYSAVDANAIVRAEAAQRNFVQTLAKTFAHLPIGLAIFDDNRQLVLFNPAVIDLTGLGADFLSARPNLLSFFDELRNKRLMPEPKNYNSWRQQIADLVAAAADGRYSEVWTLDSGRTYRVNGRPHPDGAIAFLIEDISAEVSLTRKFRAELELTQSVLDSLNAAISVFSSTGILTVSNDAYRDLWGVDPASSFAEVTIIDCLRDWQSTAVPSPVWTDLRDFVLEFGDRETWTAKVGFDADIDLNVEAVPLVSGATM